MKIDAETAERANRDSFEMLFADLRAMGIKGRPWHWLGGGVTRLAIRTMYPDDPIIQLRAKGEIASSTDSLWLESVPGAEDQLTVRGIVQCTQQGVKPWAFLIEDTGTAGARLYALRAYADYLQEGAMTILTPPSQTST